MSLSFSERWELIKIKCREFTQKYCKQLKSKINTLKTNLEQQLTKLSEELDNQVEIDDEIKKDYIRIKCKLAYTYKNECKGASIRSRTKWLEHGERIIFYESRKEKRRKEKHSKTEKG